MRRKIFTIILIIFSVSASAGNFITITGGNWENSSVWYNDNIAPLSGNGNAIVISAGNNVVLNNNIVFGNTCVLNVAGNLVINGDMTAMNNLIIIVSGNLVINGKIEASNGGSITISGNVTVTGDVVFDNNGTINLGSGHLDVGGDLIGGSGCDITGTGVVDIGGTNTFDTTPSASVTVNSGLPVTLIGFSAEYNSGEVLVAWTTASETNNASFTIERSNDQRFWEEIATVPGAGNSNAVVNYSITDAEPLSGDNYYRLTQTDFDGTMEVFDPVYVSCSNTKIKTEVYPNPFVSSVVVDFPDEMPQKAVVVLMDMKGSVVLKHELNEGESAQKSATLDVSGTPAGIYFLTVSGNGFYETSKIVKNAEF
ncbi:hypothetical protein SDC9_40311 [bioreactor metagenome]|uniref:Secretion system C-terminal sorting domain-containing protein n=1 Tax=bioreactor metagenome TaxID=1076179 RepID=A0A644VUX4_9ZZZZ